MSKVPNRNRNCKQCNNPFCLDDEGSLNKYCSVLCRNKFSNFKNGTKYRNSEKGKQTMFAWRLKSVFGITVDFYNQLLKNQNNSCAICKRIEPTGYGWHVDHCHSTNKVRGLLCSKCNQGIGLLEENTDTLKKAIEYLENSKN